MMFDRDDDTDDVVSDGLYENGNWVWDDVKNELKFVENPTFETQRTVLVPAPLISSCPVNTSLDIVEQQRYKKRMQRKYEGEDDVITLQDVKDLVLYTVPHSLLNLKIIHMLHSVTAERFLRALILYCQYHAQITQILKARTAELEKKIRTVKSDIIEAGYRENLKDLRLLASKEYCTMIMGEGDFKKFHYKGQNKDIQYISKIFETLIKVAIRVVWVALGRKNYDQLELEIHRLFRSKKYHIMEHVKKQDADKMMNERELSVLRGDCLGKVKPDLCRLHTPMFDEVTCRRDIDYRLLNLGLSKMTKLPERLKYLENYLVLHESQFAEHRISLGIIGLKRNLFDTILREIRKETVEESSAATVLSQPTIRRRSRASIISTKSILLEKQQLFEDIKLPGREETKPSLSKFPHERHTPLKIIIEQYKKWLDRVTRINKSMHRT